MTSEMLPADKYLSIVNSRGKARKPLSRVYHNMRQTGLFLKAYANLYSNDGATTPGVDPSDSIQGMSLQRIENIIQKLCDGTFQWQPNRRQYAPKADGQLRPISIPGWTDKLVQEVMRLILEAYYEPRFRNSSHGFRPHRSCQTALETISNTWTGTKWFIEGDIKGCFDNLDHNLMLTILSRDIQDNRFLKLVRQMLAAGYVDDWQYYQTYSGTPQGGVISPLLSNIVLNELDEYVEDELIPQYTKGRKRKATPEYSRLLTLRNNAKRESNLEEYKQLTKRIRQTPSTDQYAPYYRRLRYVRYADDFLLGYTGSKAEAEAIKQQIAEHLTTLKLTMSQEKTHITHAQSQKARFLGYELKVKSSATRVSKNKNGNKIRYINGRIGLLVPHDVETKWVSEYSRDGKPIHINQYMQSSDYEIVAAYGARLRGVAQYYLLAQNVSLRMSRVYWVCMTSLQKTLCAKYKIKRTECYRKYWHKAENGMERSHFQVVIQRENRPNLVAKCGELSLKTQRPSYIKDEIPAYYIGDKHSELIQRLLTEECELCGRKEPVQAHHVNKVATIRKRWQGRKEKPKWVEYMIARNRKTVMVCRSCHQDITHGRYDGPRVS
jgi:group II intron reverse transcriptase/maturase